MHQTLKYRFIAEGPLYGIHIPISVALIDYADVKAQGLSTRDACGRVAAAIPGPAALTVWDLETAATTTSNGIMIDGSIVAMAASDYGSINPEFGYLDMMEIPWGSGEASRLLSEEPHLRQWTANYPGRRLLMGPAHKNVPVHSVAITGRAGNNNAATEIMHYVTMEELLMPLGGQLELMRGGRVELGLTGGVISVGIGMCVPEEYGRIVPHRQFPCGDTAHSSGVYAQTLKSHIPCIVADKPILAGSIIRALQCGMTPGREIGASPAVMSVARHMGVPIDIGHISPRACEELSSIGYTREWMERAVEHLTPEQIIARAHEIIPGVENPQVHDAKDIVSIQYA